MVSHIFNSISQMKKVAIITTHHEPNYGNKLQNYALQTVIERLGYKVETINDARSWQDLISLWAQKKNIIHALIPYRRQPKHVKYTKFFFWSKRYIRYSKVNIHTDADFRGGLADMYDYFVVGSDQIWNPEWQMFSNEFGFATFARKEQKVAYAPSFGVSQMLPERVEEYKQWLQNWKALSCREDEGAAIIKDLTGLTVPVVLDPTLLLTRADWNKIAAKRLVKEPYMVVYAIGGMKEQYRAYIRQQAQEKHLQIINLSEEKYFTLGPDEFVSIIEYASLMITDSFHGAAFAIQYHIPITIINRTLVTGELDKLSRIITLFRYVGEEYTDFNKVFNEYHHINWHRADENINRHRRLSLCYLQNNLGYAKN